MITIPQMTLAEFKNALKKCSGKIVAIDTETTGLNWWAVNLITVALHSKEAGIEGCFDFADTWTPELQSEVRSLVNKLLKPNTKVIMHNAKFDLHMLDVPPADCNGWDILDTTIMIHLFDSRAKKSMGDAEQRFLGTNSKRSHMEQAPTKRGMGKKVWLWESKVRCDYALNDVRVTHQFAETFHPMLKKLDLLDLLAKDKEYLKLVYKTECVGFLTDPQFINHAQNGLYLRQLELERQLYDAVGYEFNWRSVRQLSKALYADLGIPMPVNPFLSADGVDRTRFALSGHYNKYNTSNFILIEKAKHPLGQLMNSLRETAKLRKTLLEWLGLLDSNSTIHTTFNLTGTRTGRLSSRKPNIQNVASRVRNVFTGGETTRSEDYNLRAAFVARPGKILVSVDYKQMEMRMFGILAQDPVMLEFLASGLDVHNLIAQEVWGVVDDTHRKWSKTISFGLIYGMTTGALQFRLDMTRAEANKVTEDYWGKFPRIKPWLRKEVVGECKEKKFLTYWSGRLWREEDENFMYKGANALIQGGCADLLSVAALRLDRWLESKGGLDFGAIISYVHDELITEVPIEAVHEVVKKQMEIMEVPDLFGLPFFTDAKVGLSYGTMVKYEKFCENEGVLNANQSTNQAITKETKHTEGTAGDRPAGGASKKIQRKRK